MLYPLRSTLHSLYLLHQSRRRIGPLPDDLFVIEEERVSGGANGKRRGGASRARRFRIQLAPRHGEREWRAGNVRRGNESIDRPDNLAHARRGTLGEIRQELRAGLVLGCREIAGVQTFPQRAIGRLHLDDETALEA